MPMRKRQSRGLAAAAVLALVVSPFLALPSSTAEITCVGARPAGGYSAEQRARILEAYPSGRVPNADTCLEALIKGPITSGDSAKFAQLLRKSHPFLDSVLLWSSGGSVEEAIKIGRLIRKGLLETAAPLNVGELNRDRQGRGVLFYGNDKVCMGYDCHCASACFLVWASGVERDGTFLGLHRPTTSSTSFATLPPDRAATLYRQLLSDIGKYLNEMEVPPRFIEAMTDTSSRDMRWLTFDEAVSMRKVPSIAEWISTTCGMMTKEQNDTHAMLLGRKGLSHQQQMLFDLLDKKWTEMNACTRNKIRKARDAINEISDQ